MTTRTDWMRDAACVCFPAYPWTEDGHRVSPESTELMGRVCSQCPVLIQCRLFVAAEPITAGFWAGQQRTDRTDTTEEAA